MRILFFTFIIFISTSTQALEVRVAEIRDTINPANAKFLEQVITEASADGNALVLIELDTPGGLVTSVRSMAQTIDRSSVPVVVYVTPAGASATSAGALLMLASHIAAMAPGTNIGAAHPVGAQGEEIQGSAGEKAANDVAAFARGLAQARGRNANLAQEIVNKSRSLTVNEALENRLIEVVAPSRADLLKALDGRKVKVSQSEQVLRTEGASVVTIPMSLPLKLLALLSHPNIATVLMTLGMMLIYVELSNPGITIAGVLGGICLLLAFMALQVLPIQTGGLALLGLGVILLLAEPFLQSGGVLGAGGVLAFVLGLLWVFDPSEPGLTLDAAVWIPSALGLTTGVGIIGIAAGRTRKLVARARRTIAGGSMAGLEGYSGHVETTSADGFEGQALIRGETWRFRANIPVHVGDQVVVEGVDGLVAKVRQA